MLFLRNTRLNLSLISQLLCSALQQHSTYHCQRRWLNSQGKISTLFPSLREAAQVCQLHTLCLHPTYTPPHKHSSAFLPHISVMATVASTSCPQIHPHLSVTFCKSIPSCFSFFCLLFCKQAVGCLTQQLKRCLFSVCWKTLWKSACTRATALSGDGSMKVPFSCTQESASLHHNLK